MLAASMTARMVLALSTLIVALAITGGVNAFAAAAPKDDPIVEEIGAELSRAVGLSIPVGVAAAFLWGGPVYAYKKFIEDPKNTTWNTRKFATTVLVGIGAALITVVFGVDFSSSLEITMGFLGTFGLTASADKLIGSLIKHWNTSHNKKNK